MESGAMKVYFSDKNFSKLLRIDSDYPTTFILATYLVKKREFVTYKNGKAVAWASTAFLAMCNHECLLDVYKYKLPIKYERPNPKSLRNCILN